MRWKSHVRFGPFTYCSTWSSGNPKHAIRRLSRRGNRTLNHVIHIAAVTQLRHRHSPSRAFYDRKRAEGMTSRAAIRAFK